MDDLPGELIAPTHAIELRSAFEQANKRAWCYFVPFLCAFSLPPNRVVHVSKRDGSVCLLIQRPDRVDLLCPPVPFSQSVLDDLICDVQAVNKGEAPRILWVDAQDAALVDPDRFDLQEKDAEYIYRPADIIAAKGSAFRDLRKQIRRFEREEHPIFRAMTSIDVPECHALLKHWRKYQGRRHPFLLDWGYTRAALDGFAEWDGRHLKSWCVDLDGQVAAFAMAGEQCADQAQFFVAKTDPGVPGLSFFLRWRVYRELLDYKWVNDAGDLGMPGLRQFKMKFRPIERLRVYSADIRGARL